MLCESAAVAATVTPPFSELAKGTLLARIDVTAKLLEIQAGRQPKGLKEARKPVPSLKRAYGKGKSFGRKEVQ